MAQLCLHISRFRRSAWLLTSFMLVVGTLVALRSSDAGAAAVSLPAWNVESQALPTNFKPGGAAEYEVAVANATGAALDSSAAAIVDSLPPGLGVNTITLTGVNGAQLSPQELGAQLCGKAGSPAAGAVVSCSVPASLSGNALGRESMQLHIGIEVPAGMAEGRVESLVRVEGGGAAPSAATFVNAISSHDAGPGISSLRAGLLEADGSDAEQAGSVPFAYVLGFTRSVVSEGGELKPAGGALRNVRLDLPPGLIGALETGSVCDANMLNNGVEGECPDSSAVGTVEAAVFGFPTMAFPLYLVSSSGGTAATFGFRSSQLTSVFVLAEMHDRDGGVSAWTSGSLDSFRAVRIAIWGDPGDPGHDRVRGGCLSSDGDSRGNCPVAATPALLRLPTSCELPLESTVAFDTWIAPGSYHSATATAEAPTGCGSLRFEPATSVAADTTTTDSPTGISVQLGFPPANGAEALATADLRRLSVILPPGLVVNPAGAGGRIGCGPDEIDLDSPAPARCPNESKIGSAQIRTPLVDHPVGGSVYLARPDDNPFGSLLAVYLVVSDEETGVALKLAGRVDLDSETGRVTIVFADLPQIPLEAVSMDLFAGERAPLRTPLTCSDQTSTAAMRPWSAPYSGPDVSRSSPIILNRAPGGGACPRDPAQAPHAPTFSGGARQAEAGSFTSFAIRIAREDGSQGIGSADVSLPPGVLAKLADVPLCEANAGRCPQASRVGSVSIWAGAGRLPIALTGEAYLSGAYKGAPASLTIDIPAIVGPFDLGTVRSRMALRIDPGTAQLQVQSDPLPTILSGVPLDLRVLRLVLDRPGFILNPTDCDPMRVDGRVFSPSGAEAAISVPFQVRSCADLGFEPKLALRFLGPTHRSAHPRLRAVLRARGGDANIGRAAVILPKTEYLDNSHIRKICTRPLFAAHACPARSIYGYAKVWSPLLDEPLEGSVYLRSSSRRLPDVVASLDGQIRLDLVGQVDSTRDRLRIKLDQVPDVPVSRVELTMKGGRKGLLVNNTQLCRARPRAGVFLRAHNGKIHRTRPVVGAECGKPK
jgi:hypothetical protein